MVTSQARARNIIQEQVTYPIFAEHAILAELDSYAASMPPNILLSAVYNNGGGSNNGIVLVSRPCPTDASTPHLPCSSILDPTGALDSFLVNTAKILGLKAMHLVTVGMHFVMRTQLQSFQT